MKIVEGDNFDGDYPDEQFVNLPTMTKEHAEAVAKAINDGFTAAQGEYRRRWWRVVPDDYVLQPGFEP